MPHPLVFRVKQSVEECATVDCMTLKKETAVVCNAGNLTSRHGIASQIT